ncbi:unnamed protein product [Schistosoma turkestanicum]|nr:unnamed protein product [Schistosoma turkestanicum]
MLMNVINLRAPTSDKTDSISLTNDQKVTSYSNQSDDILFVESHLVNRGSVKHKKSKSTKRKHKKSHKKRHKKDKKISRKTSISSSGSSNSSSSDSCD